MVGRLIEKQDVRPCEQKLAEGNSCLLAPGKRICPLAELFLCESQAFEHTNDLTLTGVSVPGLKIRLKPVVCLKPVFQCVTGK